MIDIVTSNIKNAFYQPAGRDVLIVIVHLHLKNPIMIGNKKKTSDIQFYREVTAQFDEVSTNRGRMARSNNENA